MPHVLPPPTENILNHGLIPGFVPSDFAGAEAPYEVRNPSGDWSPYLVRGEKQKYGVVDVMGCVSFSALSNCEMQIKQQTGQEVNLSDRYLAKRSGTTSTGNWLYIVANLLQLEGTVLEEQWPVPPEPFTWDQFYSLIPESVVDLTKDFRNKYDVFPKRLGLLGVDLSVADLHHHLKHAPLWVTVPGHAIAGVMVSMDDKSFTFLDSYPPFVKTRPIADIDSVWKIVLNVKKKGLPMIVINNTSDPNTKWLVDGSVLRGYATFTAYQKDTLGREVHNVTLADVEFNKIPKSQAVIKD